MKILLRKPFNIIIQIVTFKRAISSGLNCLFATAGLADALSTTVPILLTASLVQGSGAPPKMDMEFLWYKKEISIKESLAVNNALTSSLSLPFLHTDHQYQVS